MDPTIACNTDIQVITTVEEIRSCYPVMKQLRPHFTDETLFIAQIERQFAQGYKLAAHVKKGNVQTVTGYRLLEFLAWGKVLYIDDLVTDAAVRKSGSATKLLQWVMAQAREAGCDQVHLDSGPQRHDAHRLYLNHGFKIIGYHFATEL